jgi:hypothetical protein
MLSEGSGTQNGGDGAVAADHPLLNHRIAFVNGTLSIIIRRIFTPTAYFTLPLHHF